MRVGEIRPYKYKNVAFNGYKISKSENGFNEFECAYPFDTDNYNGYLEIFNVGTDEYGNYFITKKAYNNEGKDQVKINTANNKIDLADEFGIEDNSAFAYHYILKDKYNNSKVRVDSGDIIDERHGNMNSHDIYNVVTPNKSHISNGGAMKLVIIDSQNVGYVYDKDGNYIKDENLSKKAENGVKNLANKFGGTLAGLEKAIDDGIYDSYQRIISLPIFTDDDFTGHSYWNKNCFQMVSSFGNINNYASLQRKMFAHGLNFVSDGAFVNEGLQGIHFKNVLKYGEESPYYNWFNAQGLENGPLSLGIFSKNKDFISHKIVNSPYKYHQKENGKISITKNNNYNAKKPTYIQFFDNRLITEEEKNDTKNRIKTYSVLNTPNIYEQHSHNDIIFPYSFEIDPDIYNKNIKLINNYNAKFSRDKINLSGYRAAKVLSQQTNYVADGKFEGGFDTWDANPDIAKLSFITSNADDKNLKNINKADKEQVHKNILLGNYQVQDYAVTAGQYWTQKTDDILRLYIAQNLGNIDSNNSSLAYDKIIQLANEKKLPSSLKTSISKYEISNILDDLYLNKRQLSNEETAKGQIIQGLMNTPLDTIEFGDNIVSVLASPYITKRASTKDEIGVSRFDLYKNNYPNLPQKYAKYYKGMDSIYTNDMYEFADYVLKNVDKTLPEDSKLFKNGEVTNYGKYVLPLLLPEITKFAIIKSLAPNVEAYINDKNGEISYDYKKLKQITLQSLNQNKSASFEDDTMLVLSKLKKGLHTIPNTDSTDLIIALSKTLKGTNINSFLLADFIIDKSQAGLDWRIDATKDVANVEALRNANTDFEYTWNAITDFWKTFAQGVLKYNPNSYLVAEVTNENDLHSDGWGYYSRKYPTTKDILPKFLRETGMTSIANYAFFFRDLSKIFTRDFEDGGNYEDKNSLNKWVYNKFVDDDYAHSGSLDSIVYSYTFADNHDKPRALHCAALNMDLFSSDMKGDNIPYSYKQTAYKILEDKTFDGDISPDIINNYDFSNVSWKAIAMADALRNSFIKTINDYNYFKHYRQEDFNNMLSAICKSLRDLAKGESIDAKFDADAFGINSFDVSIDQVINHAKAKYGFNVPNNEEKQFKKDVFENSMKPALSKLKGIMKYLVALPGMPTLFDGDDLGSTGYDTKTKNMFLKCRSKNHEEWITLGDQYREFIAKHHSEIDKIMSVRKNPNCEALNNGAIFPLHLSYTQDGKEISSILRQSTDGKMAISIFNPNGVTDDYQQEYHPATIYIDKLYLNDDSKFSKVAVPGLRQGLKFVNANDENDVYYTRNDNGHYYLTRLYAGKDVPIKVEDTTLVLYHVPVHHENTTSFTGNYQIKPSLNYITSTYNKKDVNVGKNLELVSK